MTDVVLVHGTTQSATGFRELVSALEDLGHRAVAVDVPGGTASTSTGYARLLGKQVPSDIHRPTVVAHSAAGLLLPALARHLDAVHQVWLAAAVADYTGGRSLLTEVQENPQAVFNPEWIGVDPSQDPVLATYFLFHDADLTTLQSALATVSTCDLSAVYAETPVEDPARLPSTYVLPTDDRTLRVDWMRRVCRERLRGELIAVSGAHNFYASNPKETAAIIVRSMT